MTYTKAICIRTQCHDIFETVRFGTTSTRLFKANFGILINAILIKKRFIN